MPAPRQALTAANARRVIADGCLTPASQPQIGIELEFLTFDAQGGRPPIGALDAIAAAPLASGGRITCEPGGQLEVSSPPRRDASATIEGVARDIVELESRAIRRGIQLRAVGADRWRQPHRVVDSTRYRVMEAHFDRLGPDGRRMMCNTAALQLNVDVAPEHEQATWRAAHAIAPAMLAAFANSPDDMGTCRSLRMLTWLAMEPARTASVRLDMPMPDAWIEYAFSAPALLGCTDDGTCVPLPAPIPFGEWLGRGSTIGFPTEADLRYHLTLLFPPVRPRGWLELRYLDALPSPWWEVATHVVTALLSPAVRDDAVRAVRGTESLLTQGARYGLDDNRLAHAADRCFELAITATADTGVADYFERYVARRVPAWA